MTTTARGPAPGIASAAPQRGRLRVPAALRLARRRLAAAPSLGSRARLARQLRRDGHGIAAGVHPRPGGLLAELAREHPPLRAQPPRDRDRPGRLRRVRAAAGGHQHARLRPLRRRLPGRDRCRAGDTRRQFDGWLHRGGDRDQPSQPGGEAGAGQRRRRADAARVAPALGPQAAARSTHVPADRRQDGRAPRRGRAPARAFAAGCSTGSSVTRTASRRSSATRLPAAPASPASSTRSRRCSTTTTASACRTSPARR